MIFEHRFIHDGVIINITNNEEHFAFGFLKADMICTFDETVRFHDNVKKIHFFITNDISSTNVKKIVDVALNILSNTYSKRSIRVIIHHCRPIPDIVNWFKGNRNIIFDDSSDVNFSFGTYFCGVYNGKSEIHMHLF